MPAATSGPIRGQTARAPSGRLRLRGLPLTGYGPFRYAGAAFWLLLASQFRVQVFNGFAPAWILATFSILLATISATHQTIERMQGSTSIGAMGLGELLSLSRLVCRRLLPLVFVSLLVWTFLRKLGVNCDFLASAIVSSVDGIAFDGGDVATIAFNAAAGLLIFMIIVARGTGQDTSLGAVTGEIGKRAMHLLPALLIVFCMLLIVSTVQGQIRGPVFALARAYGGDTTAGRATFFCYVVGFAFLRLFTLVFLYASALRRSYMQAS